MLTKFTAQSPATSMGKAPLSPGRLEKALQEKVPGMNGSYSGPPAPGKGLSSFQTPTPPTDQMPKDMIFVTVCGDLTTQVSGTDPF